MRNKIRLAALLIGLLTLGTAWWGPSSPKAQRESLVVLPFLPTVARDLVPISGQLLVYSRDEDVTLNSFSVIVDDLVLFETELDSFIDGDPEYGEVNSIIERLPHEVSELHRPVRAFAAADEPEIEGAAIVESLIEIKQRVDALRESWREGRALPFSQHDFRLELGEIFEVDSVGKVAKLEYEVRYRDSSGDPRTQRVQAFLKRIGPWGSAAQSASTSIGNPVTIHPGDLHVHSCHGEAAGACAPSSNCTAESLQLSGSFSYAALKTQYQALGMEWFTATDHSYCVNSDGEYDVIRAELAAITDGSFLALPDLEVSSDETGPQSGGDLGDAVCLGFTSANHMGAHDLMHRIEGGEEGFAGFCDGLFSDVLADFHTNVAEVRSQGGYPIINHPDGSSFSWNSVADTLGQESNALHGVEIWNGAFASGQGSNVASWVSWLLNGRILYAYSGSDTHDEAFAFGANHALLIDTPFSKEAIHDAMRAGNCYISNGPSLILEAVTGGQTLLMGTQHPLPPSSPASPVTLRVHYDFGVETGTITLFEGKVGDAAETVLCTSGALTGAGVFECADTLTTSARSWYRAYAENTGVSQTAYTNPVFFEPGAGDVYRSFCFGDGGNGAGCTDCPCSNNAASGALGGCLNSVGGSGQLVVSGNPSVANDTLRVELVDGTPLTFAVLISGDNRLPANPVNPCFYLGSGILSPDLDGLRCVGGNFRRHGTRPTDASGIVGSTTPGWGPPDGPPVGLLAQSGFSSGQTRHWQSFYRENDLLVCNTGLNTTQGVGVTFVP